MTDRPNERRIHIFSEPAGRSLVVDAIAVLDSQGRVIACNVYTARSGKDPMGGAEGRDWRDILAHYLDEPHYSTTVKWFDEARERFDVSSREVPIRTAIGEERRFVLTMFPLGLRRENRIDILVISRETGTTLSGQEPLATGDRVEALCGLASRIIHEVRNPLSGVLLSTQMLAEDIAEGSCIGENVRDILAGVQRIDRFLCRLEELSTTADAHRAPFDILPVVEEALRQVRIKAQQSNLDAEMVAEENLPRAYGDKTHVGQILEHLLTNGLEALSGGGQLRLTVRSKKASTAPYGGEIVITIEDTGSGIPHEHLSKIFDPLFTTKSKRVGIGLSIVYLLVRKNHGKIDVESTPGKGTRVTLCIPTI